MHSFLASLLVSTASLAPVHAERQPFVHFAPSAPDADTGEDFLWRAPAPRQVPSRPPLPLSAQFLRDKLNEFSGEVWVPLEGRNQSISERASDAGLRRARAWLRKEYESLGFQVSEHGGWGGTNFIAEKLGKEPGRVVIVSSHMDTVDNVPGADDDGAGTVTALAIAKALSSQTFRNTLRIVAFDQEELGLIGSSEYAAYLRQTNTAKEVLADIQLEMTGYNPGNRNNFHVIDCNKRHSRSLSALVMQMAQAQGLALRRVPACTDRSDHASFWSINRPAIVISENFFGGDGNPCYHSRCDRVDLLDFDYMAAIGQAAGAATEILLDSTNLALDGNL